MTDHYFLFRSKEPDSEVDFAQIYQYLASVVAGDTDQPTLNPESSACLIDAMEDIEKQAALILNKEMEDELNDAYCTLLLNLKNTPKKYEETVESMKYFY